ncbi:4-alpha-glucanotransferase [Arcanobacterium haemolyticum]|nr:4-alpha-glucanotransferase [Arcanobacterium haemolyticum]
MSIPSRELLCSLAQAYGISTEYWAYSGELTQVPDATLVKVLAAMGADASSEESVHAALAEKEREPWRHVLPECTVSREGWQHTIHVHVPHGAGVRAHVECEDGAVVELSQAEDFTPAREIDGVLTGQAAFVVPENLPLGYHTVIAHVNPATAVSESERTEPFDVAAPLIVVPQRIEPLSPGTAWGVMAQLYSVRSHESWGVGDVADLEEICSTFGELGGDFVLVNPLHAGEPTGHMTPSPYLPVTRRFFNPLYIRVEDIREFAYASHSVRKEITRLRKEPRACNSVNGIIDRDLSWSHKREALEILFQEPRSLARERSFRRFVDEGGQGLRDFALWCSLHEAYGMGFPQGFDSAEGPLADEARREFADRIEFFMWLQWIIDEQLEHAQASARESGMEIGIFHDLAVGVHPEGAETWSHPAEFARGVTVGAPPDMYNQQGQNWSQPPWRPDALRRCAYAPLRDMIRTVLRHAGGLRVDHVMGLFRLWWIPDGCPASDGAYVRFDHEAMVGILLLEASRAGAVVVGEDLGNVESWVRDYLDERGILGTSVLWFEQKEGGEFKHPDEFRTATLTTVDTHDLPPLAGYLEGEHVRIREELGLLNEPVEQVRAEAEAERDRMIGALREAGLVGENPSECEIIEAMHRYIARTPARLLGISLVDCVGERRAQNQPGTNNEYPNWRVPLADADNKLVMVEDLPTNARLLSLVDSFTQETRHR